VVRRFEVIVPSKALTATQIDANAPIGTNGLVGAFPRLPPPNTYFLQLREDVHKGVDSAIAAALICIGWWEIPGCAVGALRFPHILSPEGGELVICQVYISMDGLLSNSLGV